MPLWLPTMLRLQGSCDWLRGDRAAAQRAWHDSLKVAERSGFPVERGLTLLEIGRRTDDAGKQALAASLFRQFGARTYLALAEAGATADDLTPPALPMPVEPERRAA